MTDTTPRASVQPTSLVVSSIAAVLALAAAAVFVVGFASRQDGEAASVASAPGLTALVATSPPVAATPDDSQGAPDLADEASSQLDPESVLLSDADDALASAIDLGLRGENNPWFTDPRCIARGFVVTFGGASAIDERFGLTPATAPEAIGGVKLSMSDAWALTDSAFACGADDSVLDLVFQSQLYSAEAKDCGHAEFDRVVLRDFYALEFMNETDYASLEEQANFAFGGELLDVKILCQPTTADAATDTPADNSDIADLIDAFDALVSHQGFEFYGEWQPRFADVCLHTDDWSLRFFEYARGTDRVTLIAGSPLGLEASDFYDYLTDGPYDCTLGEELFDFLHVGVDGEFDAEYPYMRVLYIPPGQSLPRHEHYVRRGTFVYVASSPDPDVAAQLRDLVRGTGPVG